MQTIDIETQKYLGRNNKKTQTQYTSVPQFEDSFIGPMGHRISIPAPIEIALPRCSWKNIGALIYNWSLKPLLLMLLYIAKGIGALGICTTVFIIILVCIFWAAYAIDQAFQSTRETMTRIFQNLTSTPNTNTTG